MGTELARLLSALIVDVLRDPNVQAAVRELAWAPPVQPSNPNAPGMLTITELAKALRVSRTTVGRFLREGLPACTVGGRQRFDLDQCKGWLASRGRRGALAVANVRVESDADNEAVARLASSAGLRLVRGVRR